jgi:hypothetical protein
MAFIGKTFFEIGVKGFTKPFTLVLKTVLGSFFVKVKNIVEKYSRKTPRPSS